MTKAMLLAVAVFAAAGCGDESQEQKQKQPCEEANTWTLTGRNIDNGSGDYLDFFVDGSIQGTLAPGATETVEVSAGIFHTVEFEYTDGTPIPGCTYSVKDSACTATTIGC